MHLDDFLLGAFDRLWQRWTDAEPMTNDRLLAQRALDAVWGLDINPFAAACLTCSPIRWSR